MTVKQQRRRAAAAAAAAASKRPRFIMVDRAVENLLKKWFPLLLLQKISIIKIGLVYVIMIVIT